MTVKTISMNYPYGTFDLLAKKNAGGILNIAYESYQGTRLVIPSYLT
jgi:hypothetical protein